MHRTKLTVVLAIAWDTLMKQGQHEWMSIRKHPVSIQRSRVLMTVSRNTPSISPLHYWSNIQGTNPSKPSPGIVHKSAPNIQDSVWLFWVRSATLWCHQYRRTSTPDTPAHQPPQRTYTTYCIQQNSDSDSLTNSHQDIRKYSSINFTDQV